MKFKKALVVILALAMVVTLMPTAAFATTSNAVAQTYTVAANAKIPEPVVLNLKLTNLGGIDTTDATKFSLTLTNAEFQTYSAVGTQADDKDVLISALDTHNKKAASVVIDATDKDGGYTGGFATKLADTNLELVSAAESKATILVKNYAVAKDGYINLYLNLKSKDADGEVKVAVDGLDSKISSGTYTVATVNTKATATKVIGDVKVYGRTTFAAAEVETVESTINSITGNQLVKYTLPRDFEWSKDTYFTGDLLDATVSKKKLSESVWTADTAKPTADKHYWIDGRSLYVYIPVASADNSRQALTIYPSVVVTKAAKMGDITLAISTEKASDGKGMIASESELLIAKYGDEAVKVSTVEEKDLPKVVSGKEATADDKPFVVKVSLAESVKDSLSLKRPIDFTFNKEVQVADGKDIKYYVSDSSLSKKYKDAGNTNLSLDIDAGKTKDRSEFTVEVLDTYTGWSTAKSNNITFFIPVTVKADYTGDIKLNIKGHKAGVESTDLVVGKAAPPITLETKATKVINGAQKQALADIIIKENVPGYLKDDANKNTLALAIDTLGLTNGISFDNAKVEVTEGDLEIDSKVDMSTSNAKVKNYDADAQYLMKIKIKDSSTKASTIKISGVTASLSRLLPEGDYKLEVFGPAVEDNAAYNDSDFNVATVRTSYVNIATAADTQQAAVNSKFVIGEMKYTVNDAEKTMDVAPFIDANNRTMVPIRYVANALGVADSNITYDNASTTATISGPSNVVNVRTGSKVLVASTGNITMDTTAVNSNGRLYVPVRFIANALGAEVSWDPATKTVAVFTSSK